MTKDKKDGLAERALGPFIKVFDKGASMRREGKLDTAQRLKELATVGTIAGISTLAAYPIYIGADAVVKNFNGDAEPTPEAVTAPLPAGIDYKHLPDEEAIKKFYDKKAGKYTDQIIEGKDKPATEKGR